MNNYDSQWIQKIHPGLSTFPVHANGDCFFESLQIILNSYRKEDEKYSIRDLRDVVARPVLDENNKTVNKTIETWLQLYKDAIKEKDVILREEYKHMRGLEDTIVPLLPKYRITLYNNMMSSLYWGEQYACRTIEEATGLRFLIFNGDLKQPQLNWYHSLHYKPTHYCFIQLKKQHYTPISLNGQYIWIWYDIPDSIKLFFSKSYKTVQQHTIA